LVTDYFVWGWEGKKKKLILVLGNIVPLPYTKSHKKSNKRTMPRTMTRETKRKAKRHTAHRNQTKGESYFLWWSIYPDPQGSCSKG
jgi:hypothetical protein